MLTPNKALVAVKPCSVVLEPITPKANIEFSRELKRTINERNMLTKNTRKRMTEALEQIECETEEDNKRTKRLRISAEILESEEKYMHQLETIMEFFLKPVQERALLKASDFEVLFGSIDTIHKINKELLEELRKGPTSIASAFSKLAPFFKSYSFYAFEFKKTLEILQNCQRDNPKFAKFLEMQESRPEVQMKLSALLITPIQRVPRYKLLLQSLTELTSEQDDDYSSLLDSLKKVENAAEHINKIIEERENMQRLIEVQRCLHNGQPNIIKPGRTLTKEGILQRLSTKENHSEKIQVVLTNDIVMFCKIKKTGLKCISIYPLNKCKVAEMLDKGAFNLICEGEDIVLYHESLSETKQWIQVIQKAIQTLLDDRKTLRKDNSTRRPVKRKDVHEYNELGPSPGKKLRKRVKSTINEEPRPFLSPRPPIRPENGSARQPQPSSFLVTLKPSEENANPNIPVSQEVFVFGRPHPNTGFSFKMNQFLCGLGSSVKKMFGYK